MAMALVPVPLLAQVSAGNPFRINTYTTGDQLRPALGGQPDGSCVVAWRSDGQDGSQTGIFGQRFDGRGVFLGAEFRVNSYTTEPGLRLPPLAHGRHARFPTPLGVLRAVDAPTYEEQANTQVASVIAKKGKGDLTALLREGDTWMVQ
jgi:hypothetical protein